MSKNGKMSCWRIIQFVEYHFCCFFYPFKNFTFDNELDSEKKIFNFWILAIFDQKLAHCFDSWLIGRHLKNVSRLSKKHTTWLVCHQGGERAIFLPSANNPHYHKTLPDGAKCKNLYFCL